jgi:hypothetical protein
MYLLFFLRYEYTHIHVIDPGREWDICEVGVDFPLHSAGSVYLKPVWVSNTFSQRFGQQFILLQLLFVYSVNESYLLL